jgi:signal transduction histidine kinase
MDTAYDAVTLSADDIIITDELSHRPSRAPDYEAENRALVSLTQALTEDPASVLQRVVDLAIEVTHSDSAGVSVLEGEGDNAVFRTHAVSGALANALWSAAPRNASLSGIAFKRNQIVLFSDPQRLFPEMGRATPRVGEAVFAPWEIESKPCGTLWVIKHDPSARFDAEDVRLVQNLARFAGAGFVVLERRRAAAAVRVERAELRHQLTLAEEEERRRLARELHDEAGQRLTALGLGLQTLRDIAPANSEIKERVEKLQGLANVLAQELHAVATRLRPKALDDFGLEAAISTLADELAREAKIRIDVHTSVGSRLPPLVETAVYRIVQESLMNVRRHSGATAASVVVERRDGIVAAIVEDDGTGFDVHEAQARLPDFIGREGLGLLGVRERAAVLGGTIEIESMPGSGTTVFARIPITPPLKDDK